jgi:hypothetical protein
MKKRQFFCFEKKVTNELEFIEDMLNWSSNYMNANNIKLLSKILILSPDS